MPEGDTVWLAGRTLHDALDGQVITRSEFRVPRWANVDLRGRVICGVDSYGKHLFFAFDDDSILHTHFRMDGSWHLYAPGQRWRGGPGEQIRVIIGTPAVDAVGYRLPVVEMISAADRERLVGALGPDLIDDAVDIPAAADRCRDLGAHRPVGEVLLDQRVVAGLGLIYATESLFVHGVTPWTTVGDAGDIEVLLATASRQMRANRHRYIQSTTGELARDRWHWVYERAGRPCRRCARTILIAWQGQVPHRRLAYWCPGCQRGPAPAGLTGAERRDLRTVGRSRYRP